MVNGGGNLSVARSAASFAEASVRLTRAVLSLPAAMPLTRATQRPTTPARARSASLRPISLASREAAGWSAR